MALGSKALDSKVFLPRLGVFCRRLCTPSSIWLNILGQATPFCESCDVLWHLKCVPHRCATERRRTAEGNMLCGHDLEIQGEPELGSICLVSESQLRTIGLVPTPGQFCNFATDKIHNYQDDCMQSFLWAFFVTLSEYSGAKACARFLAKTDQR